MRIFIIHSGSDKNEVLDYTCKLRDHTTSTEVLMLKNGGKLWKIDASQKIKKAQLIIVFVGKHSHESKNIEWEINKAYKYNKEIVTVRLKPDNVLPKALTKVHEYSQEEYPIYTDMTFDGVIDYIQSYTNGDYALFNKLEGETDIKLLFEQYKVFLQTSEALVNRRQSVSSFYISVNSAIIAVFSTVMALAGETEWKYAACLGFPVIGLILCRAWIRILRSYGNLNAGKMRIIRIIETKLPASLYDAEWRAQSDKLNAKPYVSFTESEVRIPKLFAIIYCCIIAACLMHYLYTHFFQ